MVHRIKILETFASAVVTGEKSFEIRKNDRGYNRGDVVEFSVINTDGTTNNFHPLNEKTYEITYVMNGYGLKNGFVVFGIKEIKNGD